MAFSDRLKEERLKAKLNQKELAELVGVCQNTVWNWEQSNGRFPKPNQIRELAEIFGVTTKWLETGLGERTPEEASKKQEEAKKKQMDDKVTSYSKETEEKLRDIEIAIKFIKEMNVPKDRKRHIHRTLSGYRTELENAVLFGELM